MLTALKTELSNLLRAIPGMGTIEDEPLDPQQEQQRLRGTTTPYWYLRLVGTSDTPASFGGGAATRQTFCSYRLELEGRRGLRAANTTATSEWEALVERVRRVLVTAPARLAPLIDRSAGGLLDLTNVRTEAIGIQRVTDEGKTYRAHHALVTADIETFETHTV